MSAKSSQEQLSDALMALEALHYAETRALRTLDHSNLDQLTSDKLSLCEQVDALGRQLGLSAEQRSTLERIRKAAFQNQLLARHARDSIRSILTEFGATPPEGFVSQRPHAVQNGVRVDFRG